MENFEIMYIHIGSNILVNGARCIGIFNIDTLKMSDDNKWMMSDINESDKTLALDKDNSVLSSEVSQYTIIKRDNIKKDEFYWSRKE